MTITTQTLVELAKVLGACGTIFGIVYGVIKWFQKQQKQSDDIKQLEEHHIEDMREVQDELCVLNYAVLAALDALNQKGYDGAVTEAHTKIEKHLNQKAHNQRGGKNG